MFGLVNRRVHAEALARRDRAQRSADERLITIKRLESQVSTLRYQLTVKSTLVESYRAELKNLREQSTHERVLFNAHLARLLEHLAPLPATPVFDPDSPVSDRMTAEEIMAELAVGKREMIARARRAQRAREREQRDKDDAQQQRREELLTDDERRATLPDFDSTLGVYTDTTPMPEKEETNDLN